jgi:hypothetical protein
MTALDRPVRRSIDTRWLRAIVAVMAFAAGYFGVVPYLLPELGAQLSGLTGQDVYFYRLTGAASFGYAVSLVVGYQTGWRGLRIPVAGMAVFAVGSIIACLIAIVGGSATWLAWVALLASAVLLGCQLVLLSAPPMIGDPVGSGAPDTADWYARLIALAGIAALGTGSLGLLLGGGLGRLFGYAGTDDFVYRQMGAAILGYAFGGLLALRSRRWAELRGAAWGALSFNALSAVATIPELARPGGINLWSIVVLVVSASVTAGLVVAIRRGGR